MGNGVLPHGPSYRAHPRLYPSGPTEMSAISPLSKAKRTSASDCRTIAIYEYTPECPDSEVRIIVRDRTRRHHPASGAVLRLPDEIMGAERSAPDATQAASLELLWTDSSVCRANPLHPGGGLLIRMHDIARLEITRAAVPCRLLITQSGPCERAVRESERTQEDCRHDGKL